MDAPAPTPGTDPAGLAIAPLQRDDRGEAIALLARAFRDNPLNAAVLAGRSAPARLRANTHGMRALLPAAVGHGLVLAAHLDERLAGVLVAAPPYGYPFPLPPLWARLRSRLGQGPRTARRWRLAFEALDSRHPPGPHWYLGTLGVHPELQGRGVGGALVRRWLEQVDRGRARAYLETDRAENVGFYRRAGFRVVEEIEVLGARTWRMERPGSKGDPPGAG